MCLAQSRKRHSKELKRRLLYAKILGYLDKDVPAYIVAAANPVGLRVVLTQLHKDSLRVIDYASRCLMETERRYSQTEKEALVLIWACEKSNCYIYGKLLKLLTDHKPLEVIYGPKKRPCTRIENGVPTNAA